jgi:cystathionine gamma-synthase
MHLRIERAQQNAIQIAKSLEKHPNILKVRYPGLMSHPGHKLAKDQLKGFGTIISFDTKGDYKVADAVCANIKLIQHATSLGAVESTMERRAAIPGQEHLPQTLLRLSVGVENVEDLWDDLEQAFQKAF